MKVKRLSNNKWGCCWRRLLQGAAGWPTLGWQSSCLYCTSMFFPSFYFVHLWQRLSVLVATLLVFCHHFCGVRGQRKHSVDTVLFNRCISFFLLFFLAKIRKRNWSSALKQIFQKSKKAYVCAVEPKNCFRLFCIFQYISNLVETSWLPNPSAKTLLFRIQQCLFSWKHNTGRRPTAVSMWREFCLRGSFGVTMQEGHQITETFVLRLALISCVWQAHLPTCRQYPPATDALSWSLSLLHIGRSLKGNGCTTRNSKMLWICYVTDTKVGYLWQPYAASLQRSQFNQFTKQNFVLFSRMNASIWTDHILTALLSWNQECLSSSTNFLEESACVRSLLRDLGVTSVVLFDPQELLARDKSPTALSPPATPHTACWVAFMSLLCCEQLRSKNATWAWNRALQVKKSSKSDAGYLQRIYSRHTWRVRDLKFQCELVQGLRLIRQKAPSVKIESRRTETGGTWQL